MLTACEPILTLKVARSHTVLEVLGKSAHGFCCHERLFADRSASGLAKGQNFKGSSTLFCKVFSDGLTPPEGQQGRLRLCNEGPGSWTNVNMLLCCRTATASI